VTRQKVLFLIPAILVFLSFFLSSCNDQPSEVGLEFWLDTITLHSLSTSDTSLLLSETNEVRQFGLFRLGGLLLGKTDNITAVTFVRFSNIPDTLGYVLESDIEECTLELTPQNYSFGDTVSNNMEFTVYRINNLWFNQTTWDSIVDPTKQPFYGPISYGTFSGVSKSTDTIALKVPISKSIASTFFELQSDSNKRITNYGLALVPNGNTNVIRRFSTKTLSSGDASNYVHLRVVFRNQRKNNNLDTILIESGVDASMVKDNSTVGNENLVVQGSLLRRAKLAFDFSMIPQNSFIHYAQLSFQRDEANSFGGTNGIDETVALSYYADSTVAVTSPNRSYVAQRTQGTQTYTFNSIISLVEDWMRYSNGKGVVYLEPEGSRNKLLELDRLSFYTSSNVDTAKRPTLKIIYSTRPGFGRR
jgi:hypothetical protein